MEARYPKYLFAGTHYPKRKIAQYLVVVENVPGALAKIAREIEDKGVGILSGNFSTEIGHVLGYWSFFADLTDAGIEPENLVDDLRKLDVVEEVLCNTENLGGLLVDTLQFPLIVMEKRSMTLKTETFGMLAQGLYRKFKSDAKETLFQIGVNAGKRKVKATVKERDLRGFNAINAIMAERIAKGWGIPKIKKFDPSEVGIETEDLFECLPFKSKMKECTSHFFRGYLSGVVSEVLGKEMIAKEERCIAKGDETCYFVIRHEEKGVEEEFVPREPIAETPKIRNELFANFSEIFSGDIKFLVLKFLASKEVASIREIARNVGMAPKNLSKYLHYLADKGVIEVAYRGKKIRLYRIAQKAEILNKFIKQQA